MIHLLYRLLGAAELRRKEVRLLIMISSSFPERGLKMAMKIRGIWMQPLDLQNTNKNRWADVLILGTIQRAGYSLIHNLWFNSEHVLCSRVQVLAVKIMSEICRFICCRGHFVDNWTVFCPILFGLTTTCF